MTDFSVFKVRRAPVSGTNGQISICLTDLNSNNAFTITVLIQTPSSSLTTGLITKGPDNFLEKSIRIRCLAGHDKSDESKVNYIDASYR